LYIFHSYFILNEYLNAIFKLTVKCFDNYLFYTYIYINFFNLEIELKPPVESPETLGIDWLFEHTESESESSDMKGNFYI